MLSEDILGTVVVGVSGADQSVTHIGVAVGFMPHPTVLIETKSGEQFSWAQHLTREPTMQEVIQYWKTRALAAELGKAMP